MQAWNPENSVRIARITYNATPANYMKAHAHMSQSLYLFPEQG